MTIENELKRIADALELIATPVKLSQDKKVAVKEAKEVMKEVNEKTEKVITEEVKKEQQSRDEIIEELIELGATVDKRQRTEILKKKLDKVKNELKDKGNGSAGKQVPVEIEAAKIVASNVVDTPSLEETIEKLRVYNSVFGKEKALLLLHSFKAKKVSDLSGKSRKELIEKITDEELTA